MNILEHEIPRIVEIEPQDDLKLLVIYEDSQKKEFDVNPYLKRFPIFEKLLDKKLFAQVTTNYLGDALIWNEDIDISGYDVWECGTSL